MLVEFLRAGSPELIRRWVAALLAVPEADRPTVVREVTKRIAEEYAAETGLDEPPMFHVASDPVQKDGHTEQIIRSYSAPSTKASDHGSTEKRA